MLASLSVLAAVAVTTAFAAVNYKPSATVAPICVLSAFNAARIQFPCQTLTSAMAAFWKEVGVSAAPLPTKVLEAGVHPSKVVLAATASAAILAYQ